MYWRRRDSKAKVSRFDYEHLCIRHHCSSLYDPVEKVKRGLIKLLVANAVNERTAALDIGGGAGILVDTLTELGGRPDNYFCLDIAQNQLLIHSRYVKAKDYPVHAVRADAQVLPVRDGSFDLIFCCEALEHLECDVRAMMEANRILKDGGHLVLSVPYAESLSERSFRISGHLNSYDAKSLERLAHECGFTVEDTFFITRLAHLLWTYPKLAIYLLWLLFTRSLVRRLRGIQIPSYYDTAVHKRLIMPMAVRLCTSFGIFSKAPSSLLGRAVGAILLLKKSDKVREASPFPAPMDRSSVDLASTTVPSFNCRSEERI